MTGPRYFHGGIPGLDVGAKILSPDVTGTQRTLSSHARANSPHGMRRDVVYVSTRQNDARVYAAFYPDGAIYEVDPIDVIGPDPDCPTRALMCREAAITAVVHPRIVLAHRTVDSWITMLREDR